MNKQQFKQGSSIIDADFNCISAPCEKFVGITFERVDLYGAHLELAEFVDCSFMDVIFTKALAHRMCITNCTFHKCSFFRADMVGVHITHSRFENCNFEGVTLCDGQFEDVHFTQCPTQGSAICDNVERNVVWS